MGYVEENLLPGEAVVYKAGLHPILFLAPALLVLLGVVLLLERLPAWAVVIIGVFFGLGRWIRVASSEFAVTDKRVVIKVGFIRCHTLEMVLGKVESVGVSQSVAGRVLGYGDIIVTGTGGTRELFRDITAPLEFRRQVEARIVG